MFCFHHHLWSFYKNGWSTALYNTTRFVKQLYVIFTLADRVDNCLWVAYESLLFIGFRSLHYVSTYCSEKRSNYITGVANPSKPILIRLISTAYKTILSLFCHLINPSLTSITYLPSTMSSHYTQLPVRLSPRRGPTSTSPEISSLASLSLLLTPHPQLQNMITLKPAGSVLPALKDTRDRKNIMYEEYSSFINNAVDQWVPIVNN